MASGPFSYALRGQCPRCGEGRLFHRMIQIIPRCSHCGLDLTRFDQGDGPAVFSLAVVGFIVAGGAILLEIMARPSYWVHAAIWLPVATLVTPASLRVFKAWLIADQYRYDADEGRLDG